MGFTKPLGFFLSSCFRTRLESEVLRNSKVRCHNTSGEVYANIKKVILNSNHFSVQTFWIKDEVILHQLFWVSKMLYLSHFALSVFLEWLVEIISLSPMGMVQSCVFSQGPGEECDSRRQGIFGICRRRNVTNGQKRAWSHTNPRPAAATGLQLLSWLHGAQASTSPRVHADTLWVGSLS